MAILAVGMLVHSARFIFDGFVFSTEWCVFLVLLMALYNVTMLIINRARDSLVLWVIMFIAHVVVRFVLIQSNEDQDSPGIIGSSARLVYDSFLVSIEWTIFLILILAIYSLVMIMLRHLQDALLIWMLIFVCHVVLRVVYSHSTDYFDW